jgi:prepilin-type N-terminal cleavage/methylation domain-containing protein
MGILWYTLFMIKNKIQNKLKAFTLVELLTVVAIIAILTSVSVLGLQEVRKKAQDTKRLSDISEMQIALETYKSVNSKYPDAGTQGTDAYITGLSPAYITKLAKDPSGSHSGSAGYVYSVSSDKKSYCFKVLGTVYKATAQKDLYDSSLGLNTWKTCGGPNASGL